jgi:dihydroflavonol-4-reductase
MKKILVTGGNGFLGANLARMLSAENYDVRIMVRKNANLQALEGLALDIFYGNIDNENDALKAVEGCDYVIHSASITQQAGISFEQHERINVTATKYIVHACLQHKIEKLIYVSTANTIGPGSMKEPGTELNGFSYFKAHSGYINSKYLAQQFVLEQVLQQKLPAVIVNPTFMIGAYDSKPSSGQIILYGLHKKILFYPPGGKNFVHIQDVCRGIINAIKFGKAGDCYLLAGENLSYKSFFKTLNKISGQHPLMIKIPPFALKLGASFCYFIEKISKKPQKLTRSAAYMLCQKTYYSGKKSERELHLKYQPAGRAIADACKWFNENNFTSDKSLHVNTPTDFPGKKEKKTRREGK